MQYLLGEERATRQFTHALRIIDPTTNEDDETGWDQVSAVPIDSDATRLRAAY